jgi:hypothetical protein
MSKIITVYHNDETLNGQFRVDFTGEKIGKIKRTDEGYLTGEAPVARIGIYSYVLKDGSIRAELVNEDTLFNPNSMKTLHLKPITDTHPPERSLNKATVKRRKVGFTGENVKRDKHFLVTSLAITDDDAINNIDNGRQELSPGYKCDLLLQPGTFDFPGHPQHGQKYDGIQLNRRYNHLATCDKARGGSELRLNLDSEMVEHCDGFEVNDLLNKDSNKQSTKKRKVDKMPNFNIEGIDYEAAQQVINFTNKETKRADTAEARIDGLDTEVKDLKTKLDKAEGERDGLKTKCDDLGKIDHSDEINKGVTERISLLNVANAILDEEGKKTLDSLKNDEIKHAVIKTKSPDVNLDGKSADYINARYDTVVETLNFDPDAIGKQRMDSSYKHDNSNVDVVEKAKNDSEEKMRNAYKDFGGIVK